MSTLIGDLIIYIDGYFSTSFNDLTPDVYMTIASVSMCLTVFTGILVVDLSGICTSKEIEAENEIDENGKENGKEGNEKKYLLIEDFKNVLGKIEGKIKRNADRKIKKILEEEMSKIYKNLEILLKNTESKMKNAETKIKGNERKLKTNDKEIIMMKTQLLDFDNTELKNVIYEIGKRLNKIEGAIFVPDSDNLVYSDNYSDNNSDSEESETF